MSRDVFRRFLSGLRAVLPVASGTAMILAVVLLNGQPSVFTDTDDYFDHGREFVVGVADMLHLREPDDPPTDPEDIADARQQALDEHLTRTAMQARSPIYGIFLYASQRIGTLWMTSAIQAALAAWVVWLLWRVLAAGAPEWTAYAVQAITAFGTTLPFFASFAMPDVFAGIGALVTVVLVVGWDRLALWERVILGLLLTFCSTVHGSHGLTILAVAVAAALSWRLLAKPGLKITASVLTIALALVGSVAISAIYMKGVEIRTGDTPGRPPFLSARLVSDGPGRAYLRQACEHGEPYVLCRFRNRPLNNSEDFLWSSNPKKSVFNNGNYDLRLKLEHEQMRFAWHVVAYDPLGVLGSALVNWGEQLVEVWADDPLRDPHYFLVNAYWKDTNLPWLIDRDRGCGRDHHACRSALRISTARWLQSALLIAALAALALRLGLRDARALLLSRRWSTDEPLVRIIWAVALILTAVVANALVCGALSAPWPRYQARIVWIVAAMAGCAWAPLARASTVRPALNWLADRCARPLAWARRELDWSAARFAGVGAVGFLVDRMVLGAAMYWGGLDYFLGRLVSFSVAVAATLLLNRSFTFRHAHALTPARQATVYVAVQGAGGLLNLAAYTTAIAVLPILKEHLTVPLAIGSAAGLCVTYLGSKHLAFPVAAAAAVEAAPVAAHEERARQTAPAE